MTLLKRPTLTERIHIFRFEIQDDEYGGYREEWRFHNACWAEVEWMGVRGLQEAQMNEDISPIKPVSRYKFTIRHRKDFPKPARLLWRDQTFGMHTPLINQDRYYAFFIAYPLFDQNLRKETY